MFHRSFISLVHFWPPPIFNPAYAYGATVHSDYATTTTTMTMMMMMMV